MDSSISRLLKTSFTVGSAIMLALVGTVAGADENDTGLKTVQVAADGSVVNDNTVEGPHVTQIRVLEEGNFLEIYWDQYVDEEAAVSPENITVTNGGQQITLVAKPATGSTSTIFFDKNNKQMAATDADSMARIADDIHMASIAYQGNIDPLLPTEVTITGTNIANDDGEFAEDVTFQNVPKVSYYSQFLTLDNGLVVKAGPRVSPETLNTAAQQIEVQLALPGTGIAERMAAENCSLAVYSIYENAYLVPEHRRGYSPDMYDVEGYGGNLWNNCVSSVSERNVLRIKEHEDPLVPTGYPDENILVHEFGHAVLSVGIQTQADQTLADEFYAVYENAYNKGLWPNTYAISNADEFFATLSAMWFNNMSERDSWEDGVRSPINSRDEMEVYDPMAFEFFSKIYPADLTMPAPWDVPAPDLVTGDYTKEPEQPTRVVATDVDFDQDAFRIATFSLGSGYQIDQFACDPDNSARDLCLWFTWGEGVWSVNYADGAYTIQTLDGTGVLSAVSDTEVAYRGVSPDADDPAQSWIFVPDFETEANIFDGHLVNAANGQALDIDGRAETSVPLFLSDPSQARTWMLEDTTRTAAQGESAFLLPVAATYVIDANVTESQYVAQQGFVLPAIEDVLPEGSELDPLDFLGWALEGETEVLEDSWQIPADVLEVQLTAQWAEDSEPVDPTDPVDPDPADPIDPADPVDPDPADPIDPVAPGEDGDEVADTGVSHVLTFFVLALSLGAAGFGFIRMKRQRS